MSGRFNEPIAIVGSACHFAADSSSPSKLWEFLIHPRDVHQVIPNTRFNVNGFYHHNPTQPGHTNATHAYLLNEDTSAFDAGFFGMKPVEAKAVDPQHRWLMETVYEGIEAAGLTIESLRGSDTGVYVGVMSGDYETILLRDLESTPTYAAIGTARSILSNRISHFFDWRGPSITLDTACSSSLVGVHLAVQALRMGEARVAVACGSNLILGPESYIVESNLRMLSPDGVCRMWDEDANGYARGDGIAVIVLKTLRDALADGDHIECIIRETGVNQDGATPGITIPSASAQTALIHQTYAKAGLNPMSKLEDRPQYFEAHGTGTATGDPIEAEAIHQAFFGTCMDGEKKQPQALSCDEPGAHTPLYVGSIKTVLGHTEGTAGLAGILKASLSLQHGIVPPNLHLNHLNNRVKPFFPDLKIVQGAAAPWPVIPEGDQGCRRASVNSFGFGGTNAHAILENYHNTKANLPQTQDPLFTPFIFSASSRYSLLSNIAAYAKFLQENPTIDIHDLAWTLRQRRSLLAYRIYFAASSTQELTKQLIDTIQTQNHNSAIGLRHNLGDGRGTLLGIFTGQGAQSARVGAELIERSPLAKTIIQSLEKHLDSLGSSSRPSWSLTSEILAPNDSSRMNEAEIAQPVCTAIQILLVDLLAKAGVHFDVVLGHSSGEIGAAYAAGALSARDALYIAYFRGLHAAKALSPNGHQILGAMIAVQTTMEDALEICNDGLYAGRLAVAASNSPSSVTISGDNDAIEELEVLLQDENKSYRRLRVDTAYHSRHMDNCYTPYVQSLRRCGVKVIKPGKQPGLRNCLWVSSVYNKVIDLDEDTGLNDTYWAQNMTQPVLFSQALQTCLSSITDIHAVLEIGPHPALKGPATQTMQKSLEVIPPYHETLVRGTNAITSLSKTLGFLWQRFLDVSHQMPDLDCYERSMAIGINEKGCGRSLKLLKGLPPYQWNHTSTYWAESRISRRLNHRPELFHPLLGHPTPDSSPHHLRWRNLLNTHHNNGEDGYEGTDWFAGHCIEGQTVLPAAGYIVTALEAARALPQAIASLRPPSSRKDMLYLQLIEIRNLEIHQAVTLTPESTNGVEILVELADITLVGPGSRVKSRFIYSAALERGNDGLTMVASAELEVLLKDGKPDTDLLPTRAPTIPHMIDVDPELFYTSLSSLGYNYDGRFRSMSTLRRKHGNASCQINANNTPGNSAGYTQQATKDNTLLVIPADLDAAFQSLLLAYSYPKDGQLYTLHLPLRIGHIRVNPVLCGDALKAERPSQKAEVDGSNTISVEASVTTFHQEPALSSQRGFVGDINIFNRGASCAAIQVQGVQIVPLSTTTGKENDRNIFTKMALVNMHYDGHIAAAPDSKNVNSSHALETRTILERLAAFYLRRFDNQVPKDSPLRLDHAGDPIAYYLEYAQHIGSSFPTEMMYSTILEAQEATKKISMLPDVDVMHLVGDTIPRIIHGDTTMLEQFRKTSILDKFYESGFAMAPSARWQARIIKQLANRNPHLNIIEVGAGTGGATKPILQTLGHSFRSYTFTDVSAGFFGTAATIFSSHQEQLRFKVLDLENDPYTQGYAVGAYDVVVASFVLHATSSLKRTLAHVRALLRPGGYLIVAEGSMNSPLLSFIFGSFPGWWVGRGDEGRTLSPAVSVEQWDKLLVTTGFSGIDTRCPISWEETLGVFLFASQAVDDEIQFLRDPLSYNTLQHQPTQSLVLIGGQTPRTESLVQELKDHLRQLSIDMLVFPSVIDIDYNHPALHESLATPVLSVADLDKPIFEGMTEATFTAFRRLVQTGRTILWVTSGRLAGNPFSNMAVGFGRSAMQEISGLNLQHLDLEDPLGQTASQTIAETFIRLMMRTRSAAENSESKALWTVEPEILVTKDGHHWVPRLQLLGDLNARHNSSRRHITQEVLVDEAPISLEFDDSGALTLEQSISPDYGSDSDISSLGHIARLRITHALLPALKTRLGHKFIVLGVEIETKVRHLALVPSITSIMRIPLSQAVPIPILPMSEPAFLSQLAAHLFAIEVTDPLVTGQTVLLHDVPSPIAEAIRFHAASKGIMAVFAADRGMDTNTATTLGSRVITLVPYLSQFELWQQIPGPKTISCFISLASGDDQSKSRNVILEGLPVWCRKETVESLYAWEGHHNSPVTDSSTATLLQRALTCSKEFHCVHSEGFNTISLQTLVLEEKSGGSKAFGQDMPFILDMAVSTCLPTRVLRPGAKRPLFRADRTYWVVGLSGTLGVSLCDWLARAGVRHLVISSRNPAIELAWIESHRRNGVYITIVPCDVTNYTALATAHANICSTLPPISGVFNGAMVLRDTVINNMTFSQLKEVVGPKVMGSINLDRLFSTTKTALDFFILFSSINYTIGNPGQANYAAANAFQCALAAARRRRGLPGVALNIGAIIGAGYLHRTEMRKMDLTVARGGLIHLSEEDFHQIVAAGVIMGRVGSDDDYNQTEITAGLLEVPEDATDKPIWFYDPKFTHLIKPPIKMESEFSSTMDEPGVTSKGSTTRTLAGLQSRVRDSRNLPELENIIKEALAVQLRYELQMKVDDDELMEMRGNELGIDSLISVDIRNWFLKSLSLSIPVLRIMSNNTMMSLVSYAASNIPAQMVPNIPPEARNVRENEDEYRDTTTNSSIQHLDSVPSSNGLLRNTTSLLDFDVETQPPLIDNDLLSLLRSSSQFTETAVYPPKCVVLTGATGLLGQHLLSHLIQVTPLTTRVVCIATRQLATTSKEVFLGRFPRAIIDATTTNRVTFFAGDLSSPRLGLSTADYANVFAAADVVIHAGADTSHLKSYDALRQANIGSTSELARLCLLRKVPLHFVSTAGVGLFSLDGEPELLPAKAPGIPPSSLAADGDGTRGVLAHSGYTVSKWVCERLLEQTSAMHNLPVWIHRPSTIIRQGQDTQGERARLDWLNQLVLYAREMGAVPEVKHVTGAMDLVYVKTVCEQIVQCVLGDKQCPGASGTEEAGVSYVHETGDMVIPLESLERLLELDLDGPLTESHLEGRRQGVDQSTKIGDHTDTKCQKLAITEWTERAVSCGLHPAVATLIEAMDQPDTPAFLRIRRSPFP